MITKVDLCVPHGHTHSWLTKAARMEHAFLEAGCGRDSKSWGHRGRWRKEGNRVRGDSNEDMEVTVRVTCGHCVD